MVAEPLLLSHLEPHFSSWTARTDPCCDLFIPPESSLTESQGHWTKVAAAVHLVDLGPTDGQYRCQSLRIKQQRLDTSLVLRVSLVGAIPHGRVLREKGVSIK